MCRILLFALSWLLVSGSGIATTRADMFRKASQSIVNIEFFVQREIDRQAANGTGMLVSPDGLLICLPNEFPDWVPPDNIRSIEVFLADNPLARGLTATYLGQDWVYDWHYIRIDDWETAAPYLVPITEYPTGRPEVGDLIWGVGLTGANFNYIPYYMEGRLSTIQPLPEEMGFSTDEVAAPGGPVFLEDGSFCGWAGRPIPAERDLWVGTDFLRANIRNPSESLTFLLAEPFLKEVGKRIPDDPAASMRPWIGVTGTQPLDKETARFMGLDEQGVIAISEILPETPAAIGGLQDRDLLLAIDGAPLPNLKPDSALQEFFERELKRRPLGEAIGLTVLRGEETLDLEVIPQLAPKSLKQAPRHYLPDLGLSIREFLVLDAIQRRQDHRKLYGAVTSFIRPNSPAASAELQPGDWILEIAGEPVDAIDDAIAKLEAAAADVESNEVVLLIQRAGETAVLRIRKG
jgi:serine protease Do